MSIYRRRLMIANTKKEDIPDLSNYPGLIAAWSAAGKSNNDEDRATLKDLTGKGHDITLNGFAFNTEGSGYGHPEYPDALVFDGVDDCGINEEMPILTDYTIIVKRKYLSDIGYIIVPLSYSRNTTSGTSAVFWFELLDSRCVSFGRETKNINILASDVSYQTKYKYNGSDINIGSYIPSEAQTLTLGFTANRYFTNIVFYSAYLFDRSLDEQEIKAFIRKYIDADYVLPSEQTTE